MIFWDSSAIVPLLVSEASTGAMSDILASDADILVWWATRVECLSALTRLERTGSLGADEMSRASERLGRLADRWHEVEPIEIVRETASRFLRVHALRSADALQLAAAFIAAESRPPSLQFLTLDDRLAEAARKEGFDLVAMPEA